MLLRHETSLAAAVQIIKTRKFYGGPISGDGGINAHIIEPPGRKYTKPTLDDSNSGGVFLDFEWMGELATEQPNFFKPGVVYDHGWRVLIPVGTRVRLVAASWSGLSYKDWEIAVPQRTGFISKLFASLRNGDRAVRTLMGDVEKIVLTKPEITVVFPPNCIYKTFVEERYPEVCQILAET